MMVKKKISRRLGEVDDVIEIKRTGGLREGLVATL